MAELTDAEIQDALSPVFRLGPTMKTALEQLLSERAIDKVDAERWRAVESIVIDELEDFPIIEIRIGSEGVFEDTRWYGDITRMGTDNVYTEGHATSSAALDALADQLRGKGDGTNANS